MTAAAMPGAGWVVLGLCAFLIGLAKSGLPGVGILVVPLAAAILPARASTGLILPLLIAGDVLAVRRFRRHAEWGQLLRLLPPAFAGVLIGYWMMNRVTDAQLRPLIGGVILGLLILGLLRARRGDAVPAAPRPGLAVATGLLAGITTMLANAAGPIMTLYLLSMRLPKAAFIGTGAWYFLLINCVKVPFSMQLGLITMDSLWINLPLLPFVWAGSQAGRWLLSVTPQNRFETIVRVLAATAAIRLLIPA